MNANHQYHPPFPSPSTGMNNQYQQYSWQSAKSSNVPYNSTPWPSENGTVVRNAQLPCSQVQEDSDVTSSTITSATTTTTTSEQTVSGVHHAGHHRLPTYQQPVTGDLQTLQYSGQSTFSQYYQPQSQQPEYQQPQLLQQYHSHQLPEQHSHHHEPQYSQDEVMQHYQPAYQQFEQSQSQQTQYPQSQYQQIVQSQYQHQQTQQPQYQHNDQPQYQQTQHQQHHQIGQSQYQQLQYQLPAAHFQQPQLQTPPSQTQAAPQRYLQAAEQNASIQPMRSLPLVAKPEVQPIPNRFAQLIQPVLKGKPPSPKDSSQPLQSPPPAKSSSKKVATTKQTTTKTTIETTKRERYEGDDAGGKAREVAEKKGEKEVQRFEKKVQKLIRSIDVCPMEYPLYNTDGGYLCAEGIHFLYHEDIDMAFERPGWLPQVTMVNSFEDPDHHVRGLISFYHPPEVDFWQPMHRNHREFCRRADAMGCSFTGKGSVCQDKCFKHAEVLTRSGIKRRARDQGYDPNFGRHGMFG